LNYILKVTDPTPLKGRWKLDNYNFQFYMQTKFRQFTSKKK